MIFLTFDHDRAGLWTLWSFDNFVRGIGVDAGDGDNGVDMFLSCRESELDGIVSLGVWEFSDHVYRDHLPASIRDLVGDQLPHLLRREGLHPVACVASCDKLV